ncbi:uncharacterized protein L203_105547 [Cryptococcus depauperatus CBS 7841]|uniref:Uncharacterized protein n=1 Tax=Cryptococcus depauperatus CBS 7841 TaxID=1295531 RepID=A0AAJ8JXN8_9TREE
MKVPKRIPWTSHVEFSKLYDMLFSPEADTQSRQRGVARMSIYISSPSCPSFIHLLHSLVVVDLLPYPPQNAEEAQRMRMTMGMAIVRFVNGIVDPLQTGLYARPISHLAAILGLPASLIALRHRATHEDLPPLSLLHQAVGQCIYYLHQNSFLPLLSSVNHVLPAVTERQLAAQKRLDGLMKRWKKVMKIRLRENEVREEDASAVEMKRVKKEIEDMAGVEYVVKSLVEAGGLVPLAKRKRVAYSFTSPSPLSLRIWEPLLNHLCCTTMPDLPSVLSTRIMDLLLNPSDATVIQQGPLQVFSHTSEHISFEEPEEENKRDEGNSYRWGLSAWLLHIWRHDAGENKLALEDEEKKVLYKRLAMALLHKHNDTILVQVNTALAKIDERLQDLASGLSRLLPVNESEGRTNLESSEADLSVDQMEKRLAQFENKFMAPKPKAVSASVIDRNLLSVPGWRRLTSEEWSPCPIGVAV